MRNERETRNPALRDDAVPLQRKGNRRTGEGVKKRYFSETGKKQPDENDHKTTGLPAFAKATAAKAGLPAFAKATAAKARLHDISLLLLNH